MSREGPGQVWQPMSGSGLEPNIRRCLDASDARLGCFHKFGAESVSHMHTSQNDLHLPQIVFAIHMGFLLLHALTLSN